MHGVGIRQNQPRKYIGVIMMFLAIKSALLVESNKKMKDEDLDLLLDSIKEIDNKLSYVIKKINDMDELY